MARLQSEFKDVGLTHHTGRKTIFVAEPTEDQKKDLSARGIDVSRQRLFECSPNRRN
jgi:hypothetical protein